MKRYGLSVDKLCQPYETTKSSETDPEKNIMAQIIRQILYAAAMCPGGCAYSKVEVDKLLSKKKNLTTLFFFSLRSLPRIFDV